MYDCNREIDMTRSLERKSFLHGSPMGVLIAIVLGLAGCTFTGGNSSQTGNNGITVTAHDGSVSGTTHPGARVAIFEKMYRPYGPLRGYCDSTIADGHGNFLFVPHFEASFNIFVSDSIQNTCGYIPEIPMRSGMPFTKSIDELREGGYISGTSAGGEYAFIPGSPYCVQTADSAFRFGPLPEGSYVIGIAYTRDGVVSINEIVRETLDTVSTTVAPGTTSAWHP
jgi:hypothetical protein